MGGFFTLTEGIPLRLRLGFKALTAPVVFGVSALITTHEGKILLVRHRFGPGLHLPGGGVNWGEPPIRAVWREAQEEVGLTAGAAPELFGLYSRRIGITTNVVALYHIADAEFSFGPNLEIVETVIADPASPPPGTTESTKKRLAEFFHQAPKQDFW